MVASGTSLLGLVKHLTRVEVTWFQYGFAGAEVRVPGEDLADDDPKTVINAYLAAINASNSIVTACDDLSRPSVRAVTAPRPRPLRWILIHMVEETGRHAGHADILREQLDGSAGR